MTDGSISFFSDIIPNSGKNDTVTGLPLKDISYQTSEQTYDKVDPLQTLSVAEITERTVSVPVTDNLQVVNYKGNSPLNDFNPLDFTDGDTQTTSGLEAKNIIQWVNKNAGGGINLTDFKYLKEYGVIANNRLMCLRRYGNAKGSGGDINFGKKTGNPSYPVVHHDLTKISKKPTQVLLGYYSLDEYPIKLTFNEKWTSFNGTFLDVIQDVIGINFSSIPVVGDVYSKSANSPLAQDLMYKVGTNLGFISPGGMPYGDPNLIHEAAIRDVSGESLSTGLETGINIEFETTYTYKYFDSKSRAEWLAIVANAINMGTSDSRFLTENTGIIKNLNNQLASGNIEGLITDMVGEIKNLINEGLTAIKETANKIINAKDSTDGIDKLFQVVKNAGESIIKQRYRRYKWKMLGVIGAMTGEHTAPWHITLGNPTAPWFTCGNLVVKSCEIIPSGEMNYDDIFSEFTIKIKLENGRAMGAQEIQSLFNAGKGRILDDIPEVIKTIKEKNTKTKQPGKVVSTTNSSTTAGTNTNNTTASDPAMNIEGTTAFSLGN